MPFLGKTPTVGNFILLDAITVSNTATFALTKDTLDYYPGSAQNMIVSVNGVTQAPLTAYTITDSNIIFSSALDSDVDVIDYILVLGDTLNIGRPSDSTVGATQIQDYAVTSVKMSNTGVGAATYGTSTSIPQITIDAAGRITSATGIDRSNQFEDLTVTGNLTVSGNTVTVDAQTLSVEDPLIHLAANNETSDVVDIGFVGHYSNDGGTTKLHTGFFRDASDEQYYLFNGFEDDNLDLSSPSTTIDRTANTFALANLNTGKINATVDSNIAAAFSSTTTTAKITLADANDQAFIDINASRIGIGHSSSTSLQALQIEPTSAEAMRIDSSGNVGIGTGANIDANLHIYNAGQPPISDSLYANMILDTDSTNNYQRIRFDVGATPYWGLSREGSTNNFTISGRINSTWTDTALVITPTGKVGINTNDPQSVISSSRVLEIGSGGNTTISVRSTDGVNDRNAILELLSTGNGGSKSVIIYGDTDTTPSSPSPLSFQSYHSGTRSERMVLNEDGYLGIGVESTIYHLQLYRSDSAGIWTQWTNSTTGSSASDGGLFGIDSNEDIRIIQQEASKNVEIWNNVNGTSTQILTVDHNGRVGLGTGGNSLSASAQFYSNDNAWPLIFQNTVSGGETFYAGPTNVNFSSGAGKFLISDHSTSSNAFFQYEKSSQYLWLGSYNVKNEHRTILAGKGVESNGTNYGSYGQLEFYSNNNYTGGARRWLITNALRANTFGIIRSTDASTSATIGAFGGTVNGTTDFAITNAGKIGMGTEVPQSGSHLEIVHTNLSAEPYTGIVVKNTSTSGNYYTGVTADAVGQAHFRFALNGALKWQWRVGSGVGTDQMDLYSWTAGRDIMTIQPSGSFLLNSTSVGNYGQTSGIGNLTWRADNGSSGGSLIVTNNADRGWALAYFNKFAWNSGDDNRLINWYTNGSSIGSVTTNGSTVTYGGTSDYRRKQNVVALSNAIDRVKQLNPIRFEWISDITPGTFDGFIAHEVQEVVPEAVEGIKDAVDEDGEIKPQTMDPGKLVPLLTAALQEAIARIEALESA